MVTEQAVLMCGRRRSRLRSGIRRGDQDHLVDEGLPLARAAPLHRAREPLPPPRDDTGDATEIEDGHGRALPSRLKGIRNDAARAGSVIRC